MMTTVVGISGKMWVIRFVWEVEIGFYSSWVRAEV